LIVVAGWEGADRAVRGVSTGRTRAQGTYLAPWLLTAPLLGPPAGQLLPLRFHPGTVPSLTYAMALDARFPGEPPSAAGYAEWSRTTRATQATGQKSATQAVPYDAAPLRLYAASQIYVPGMPTHTGHGTGGRWLPNGTVTPITGPLDEPT
jgi:hypothetical protein